MTMSRWHMSSVRASLQNLPKLIQDCAIEAFKIEVHGLSHSKTKHPQKLKVNKSIQTESKTVPCVKGS